VTPHSLSHHPFRPSTYLVGVCLAFLAGCATQPPQAKTPQQPVFNRDAQRFHDTLPGGMPGPGMVVVPAGSFLMGSPTDEAGRYDNEGPQHRVTFQRPFALGRSEISVGEFKAFVAASGYQTLAERGEGSFFRNPATGGWRLNKDLNWRFDSSGQPARDAYPVVHVSWVDAQAYVQWLAAQTGQRYRLPSEAELEYANRGGSQSRYWWGDATPAQAVANLKGELDKPFTPQRLWDHTPDEQAYAFREGDTPLYFSGYQDGYGQPAPVASFLPNGFGLYDTTGNVWEWAQDCWHPDYTNAPRDGSAWTEGGDCEQRLVRGGSWYCYPRHMRAANRWARWPVFRNMYIGFRVARDL
jgi:formylglycine-generating enzyme required for sulfatase activity